LPPRRAAPHGPPKSKYSEEPERPQAFASRAFLFIFAILRLSSARVLVAALRSFATYVAVSLYVLVTGVVGMLLATLFGWVDLLYIFGHGGVRLGLALSGITYRIVWTDRLPRERAAVFCCNHQSNVDPPILYTALHPRLHILYKQEIDAIPVLARAFRMGGFIPIDRHKKESAMRSIEAAARSIKAGASFLIFPEGTRSKTDEMLPFKKGGFIMAIKAGAPIVPVAIQGGRAAMRRGSKIIRPVRVSIRAGRPIETAGLTLDDRDALIVRVREAMAALLAQGPIRDS
jgi:1-acyl-sn-glycerol-3-phosphate acyltransferase